MSAFDPKRTFWRFGSFTGYLTFGPAHLEDGSRHYPAWEDPRAFFDRVAFKPLPRAN
jgi:hypothetical protein